MKQEIINKILKEKVVAVVRLNSTTNSAEVIQAIIDGGIKIIEITLTTPGALELIEKFSSESNAVIGAGSILDKEAAEEVHKRGAKFVVSPITNNEVIDYCNKNDLAVMPGAFTPTEVKDAFKKGADIVKVFPADNLGMSFFKNILAPMPDLKIMPTGGVTIENAADWIEMGACAVGIGSALVPKNLNGDELLRKIKENSEMLVKNVNKNVDQLEVENGK